MQQSAGKGLRAEGIVVRFGGLAALQHVDIEVPPMQITGLIGPNGAGKTTLFNVCCGFLRPNEGRVFFDGANVTQESAPARARRGLGRTFQKMQLFRSLTVWENIALAAESLHIGDDPLSQIGLTGASRSIRSEIKENVDHVMELTALRPIRDALAGELPTGYGRRLELARALARHPETLLLDEPSSGLDRSETAAFGELLLKLAESEGTAMLVVEHDMSLVLHVSKWIHVLDFGHLLMAGTPAQVSSSDAVRAAYLGKETVA